MTLAMVINDVGIFVSDDIGNNTSITITHDTGTQSEIYHRGNVENDCNSSVVRRWPSKAIIGFSSISNAGSAALPMLAFVGNARDFML